MSGGGEEPQLVAATLTRLWGTCLFIFLPLVTGCPEYPLLVLMTPVHLKKVYTQYLSF